MCVAWAKVIKAGSATGSALAARQSPEVPAMPDRAARRVAVSCYGLLQTVRQSGKDDYDKFSLPTGSGLPEDILDGGARRFISDAEFGRSGSQCFSCDEMDC
jgi:hypothetical protein